MWIIVEIQDKESNMQEKGVVFITVDKQKHCPGGYYKDGITLFFAGLKTKQIMFILRSTEHYKTIDDQ